MDIEREVLRTFRLMVRRALKLTVRSVKPQVEVLPTNDGVSLRVSRGGTAISRFLPGRSVERPVGLPYHFLEACQGRRGLVVFNLDGSEMRAEWQDGSVPRVAKFEAAAIDSSEDDEDVTLIAVGPHLVAALSDAASVTDHESLRYALGCVELSGVHGRVTGTDGKQLLSYSGLRLPWQHDILVDFGSVFSSAELLRSSDVRIGATDGTFFLQCHPWLIQLPINRSGRFPDVDRVLPDPAAAVCRVRLAELDRQFLEQNLSRLPGADRQFSPVTVELNGRVALFAADDANEQVTEVVLSKSTNRGGELSFATDRNFLRRAVRLGLEELCVFGSDKAVLCRGEGCSFAWMPLKADFGVQSTEPTLRIESAAAARQAPRSMRKRRTPSTPRADAARRELEQLATMATELAGRLRSEAAAIAG